MIQEKNKKNKITKKQKNKTKKQNQFKIKWKKTAEKYKQFCNRLIGRRLSKKRKLHKLNIKLQMANLKFTPTVYLSTILISTLIVLLISLLFYTFIFNFIIHSSTWYLYVLVLTGITTGITAGFLPFTVRSKISTRKRQIDHELPFILSELSILASTGITPIKIFRHMASRGGTMAVNHEFKKIVYKMDVEGKDIITAISESAKQTPSTTFREVLWDLANMMHQGGDLDLYLRQRADTTMEVKRDMQKEFIEKLGTYSEMYMSLVLTGTLFIAIAAFLIDAMQAQIAGLDANTLLILLSYIMIPAIVIAVNVIISMAYSKS
jgi:flagellar protein FlaJ